MEEEEENEEPFEPPLYLDTFGKSKQNIHVAE